MADLNTQETKNEGEGNPPATSAGSSANQLTGQQTGQSASTQTPAPRTFTQEDIDALMGKTRNEARDRAIKSTLEGLGFEDLESAQTAVNAWKQHQKEQMSELEQAQAEVTRLANFEEQFKSADKQIKELNTLIANQVKAQVEQMKIPDHLLPLLNAMPVTEQLAYLTEHGANFVQPATSTTPPATNAGNKGGTSKADEEKTRKRKIHAQYGIQ